MTKIPLHKVFMSKEASEKLSDVIHSGYIGQGEKVKEFEAALGKKLNRSRVLCVNSCTSALSLCVHLLDLEPEDEIICPVLNCFAGPSAIAANNVRIKWCDVDICTFNLDLNDLERKLSPYTKAIMLVHWGGAPAINREFSDILGRAEKLYGFRPKVIEDYAHSFGGKFSFHEFNRFECYSFGAVKNPTCGDGGAIACFDESTYQRAKRLRWYGMWREYDRCQQNVMESGYKYHMNDINASIGLANLPYVDEILQKQRDNCKFYFENLRFSTSDQFRVVHLHELSTCYYFPILVERRDHFMKMMQENGIETSPIHTRNDAHSCFKKYRCLLPNMDYIEPRLVNLPCGWWLTNEDREYIVECMKGKW